MPVLMIPLMSRSQVSMDRKNCKLTTADRRQGDLALINDITVGRGRLWRYRGRGGREFNIENVPSEI